MQHTLASSIPIKLSRTFWECVTPGPGTTALVPFELNWHFPDYSQFCLLCDWLVLHTLFSFKKSWGLKILKNERCLAVWCFMAGFSPQPCWNFFSTLILGGCATWSLQQGQMVCNLIHLAPLEKNTHLFLFLLNKRYPPSLALPSQFCRTNATCSMIWHEYCFSQLPPPKKKVLSAVITLVCE